MANVNQKESMSTTKDLSVDRDISAKMSAIASILANEGIAFNKHLVEQFKRWEALNPKQFGKLADIPKEHIVFYQSISQTIGWMQQLPLEKSEDAGEIPSLLLAYFQILLEARTGKVGDIGQRLEQIREVSRKDNANANKPRRFLGVISCLETWSQVDLTSATITGAFNLEILQNSALNACGRARWSALAPLKMYALVKKMGANTPKAIYPPMGRGVSRGIERFLGFALGESENDYTIARDLHLKLAELSGASVWDINSSFYRLGGGK